MEPPVRRTAGSAPRRFIPSAYLQSSRARPRWGSGSKARGSFHGELMRLSSPSSVTPAGVLIVGAIIFTAMGLTNAACGPALPELARKTATSLAGIGTLLSALYFGAVAGQLVAGPISDRVAPRPVIVAGMLAISGGALGIALCPTLELLLAAAAIAGLGFGALDVATNLLVAAVFAERRAAALNLVAMFYGAGSVGGPALAAVSLKQLGSAIPVLWVSAGVGVAGLLLASCMPSSRLLQADAEGPRPRPVYRDPLVLALGLLLLLYVGIENGVGAWTTTYLVRTTSASAPTGALLASGYWLALTLGRAIGAALSQRLRDVRLLRISLVGAVAFGLLLVLSVGHLLFTAIAVLGMGLCFGPISPIILAVTTRAARHAPGAGISLVSAISSAGAMLMPWAQGALLERVSPGASVALSAAVTAAMLSVEIAIVIKARL
ncbi:MFS transporter [Sorangium sp. So ce1128]